MCKMLHITSMISIAFPQGTTHATIKSVLLISEIKKLKVSIVSSFTI